MKGVFPKILLFVVLICGLYTYLGQIVPQAESHPPEPPKLELGMKTSDLVEIGKNLVNDKNTCLMCHTIGAGGGRGPDLAGLGKRAETREPGKTAEQYLMESLYHPQAYVVQGYGPTTIMPEIDKPPINFTKGQIKAVVAYLETLGGTVTAKVEPSDIEQSDQSHSSAALDPAKLSEGRRLFHAMGCLACHTVGDEGGHVGSNLSSIGAAQTPAYLRESILTPNKVVVAGFPAGVMPQDFAKRMKPEQIDALVTFLMAQKGIKPEPVSTVPEAPRVNYSLVVILVLGGLAWLLDGILPRSGSAKGGH